MKTSLYISSLKQHINRTGGMRTLKIIATLHRTFPSHRSGCRGLSSQYREPWHASVFIVTFILKMGSTEAEMLYNSDYWVENVFVHVWH